MNLTNVCIADQIGNYIKYAFDTMDFKDPELKQYSFDKAMEYYKELRGDLIINGQNPRGLAGGIIYIACYLADWEFYKAGNKMFRYRTKPMLDIADVLNINANTVRKYSYMIRRHFKLG